MVSRRYHVALAVLREGQWPDTYVKDGNEDE